MQNICSAIKLSFKIGAALLENGAEISRVQDTMERVAKAYDVDEYEAYVLSNAVFATGIEEGVKQDFRMKYVKNTQIHIGRISAINQLSREIAAGKYDVHDANIKLEEIKEIEYSSRLLTTIACAIGSVTFTLLLGGGFFDLIPAFVCGLALEPTIYILNRAKLSKFLINLAASALMAFLAIVFVLLGIGDNLDKIIIGSIIRLVPGVALTTSIRDFFNGDYLSGTIRMIDALLIGGCIGVGVGAVVMVMSNIFGGVIVW